MEQPTLHDLGVHADTIWIQLLGAKVWWCHARGVRTRTLEAGDGPPLILLHGISGHAETFQRNIIPLAHYAHVYAIDLLGHGYTDKPDLAYSLEDFLEHLCNFMDSIGVQHADFIGQSLGGWIASWLAIRYPDRVRRLILDTSAGLKVSATRTQFQQYMGNARAATAKAVNAPTRENVRERLAWLLDDPADVTEEMVEIRYQISQLPGAQAAMSKILNTFTGADNAEALALTEDRLAKIQSPTCLIWGRNNISTSWQEARQASQIIPRAQFHVIDHSAHWPQFEEPEEFNRIVMQFLCDVP